VRCVRCDTELIPGKRFCHACGLEVGARCGNCGAALQASFRFCPDCGTPVPGAPAKPLVEAPTHEARVPAAPIDGERKQVTVLFCDLVGSTAIAERLDPEEYRELIDRYLEIAFREIGRFAGTVNRLAGDGLMALFGAPIAHEDAPARAVRAALAVRDALAALDAETARADLTARIGIHTGPVVVGNVGTDAKMDYTAIGDTTNLASRLESLARPGSVLVSEATHRLVRGFFRVRPTGPLAVKGKSESVSAYEVLAETPTATAMSVAAERGLTPFVGRDEQLAQLDACFARLEGGLGQVVAIVGEAGSGKSRLLYEFTRRLAGTEAVVLEGRCSSLSQAVPFAPFVAMIERHLGTEAPAGDETTNPLLALLDAGTAPRRPDEQKRDTFEAVARLVLTAAQRGPVVIVVEDLHWIDDASRELLEHLVARLQNARAMVVVSQRPEGQLSWRARGAFTQLVLRRLPDADALAIVRSVAGGELPTTLERQLVAKAEGSPFFAEEITRSLVEEGYFLRGDGRARLTRPVGDVHIPGTVQEVIAARLDRLSAPGKRVLQVAAVLGRQFARSQLAALLAEEGIDVGGELEDLERRGLVHRKHVLSSDEYRFGESLTQDVAYESLLLRQRRLLHERIGLLLEAAPGAITAERSALLAHHFSRSDNRSKAIAALLRAGRDAEELPAYRTAVDLLRRCWELAEAELAAGGGDDVRRAALQATLALARIGAIFGAYPHAEATRAALRGRELAEALGDENLLAQLLYFQGEITIIGDQEAFARGLALAEESVTLAKHAGHPITALSLARGVAILYALDGRFAEARASCGYIVNALEEAGHRETASDLYVSTRWIQDNILYLSDAFDEALASATETHAFALRGPNRTVHCGAATTLAQVHFMRAEYREALRWAEEALEVAESIANVAGLSGPAALVTMCRVELGLPVDGERYLSLIEQSLGGGETLQSNFRFAAEAMLAVGDHARAERWAEQLRSQRRGGRLREAFASASIAQIMLRRGRWAESERAVGHAITVAEAIGARSVLAGACITAAELAEACHVPSLGKEPLARALPICRELRLARLQARVDRLRTGPAPAAARG
jgi:class 3 adenylate cyclase